MNTRNIKYTIGGPEVTAGGAVARTKVLPIREKPGFREAAEKLVDPAIVGKNMVTGEYLGARNLNGPIPLSPRPCGGWGMILNSLMVQEGSPAQIGAVARIRYKGAEASANIVADTTADELTATIGALGAEAVDTDFGTDGVISLAAEATDTVGELVTVINAYTHWDAEQVTGDAGVDAGLIINITAAQASGRWVYLYFTSAASGLYLHSWPVDLTNTARKTYSIQADGVHANYLGLGCAVDSLSLSGALKAMVEAEAQAMGFSWTAGQEASAATLEAVDPFLYYDGSFSLNGVAQPFVRNLSLEIGNNGDAEGFGMGSASRQYHSKGEFTVTASLQLRYTAAAYELYAKVFNNAQAGLDVYFRTPGFLGDPDDLIRGLMIVELPYCNVSDYDATDNNGVLDTSISLRAITPPGQYGSPCKISMITADSGAY